MADAFKPASSDKLLHHQRLMRRYVILENAQTASGKPFYCSSSESELSLSLIKEANLFLLATASFFCWLFSAFVLGTTLGVTTSADVVALSTVRSSFSVKSAHLFFSVFFLAF